MIRFGGFSPPKLPPPIALMLLHNNICYRHVFRPDEQKIIKI